MIKTGRRLAFIYDREQVKSTVHSGYPYYIDGYKKYNRTSQSTVIAIKITALKTAIE